MPKKNGKSGEGRMGERVNFSAGVEAFGSADKRREMERKAVQSGASTKERGEIAKSLIKGRNKERPVK